MTTDGRAPDYLILLVFLFASVFLVQFVFFSKNFEIGIFISLSLVFYFGFFLSRDKGIKRRKLEKTFSVKRTWFHYRDEKLPENIP